MKTILTTAGFTFLAAIIIKPGLLGLIVITAISYFFVKNMFNKK